MPKFRIKVKLDNYWDYVQEFSDAQAAKVHGTNLFFEDVDTLEPEVEVEEVPEDTPTGDTG